MKIVRANRDDWNAVHSLLTAEDLPTDDMRPDDLGHFLVARQDGAGHSVIATIGLQLFGSVGLLRSLVVGREERNSGLGAELVAALEATAVECAIEVLYLLTIDADRFFARLGFATVVRAEVPDIIRSTREFSELCPDDAIVMRKAMVARSDR